MMPGFCPIFAIVIPVFDRFKPLLKCLRLLNCQKAPPLFEVIIVDDGSGQEVAPELAGHPYSFPISIVRQAHLGISAARNRGISQTQAAAVLFIDSDCEADPNLLREFADALDRYPNAVAFQASLQGHRDSAVGQIEDSRLQAIQRARTLPDGRISYLNTSGLLLRRNELFPWPDLFDVSAVRDADTFLLARLAAQGLLPQFVPSAIVYHVPDVSLRRYLWKQVSIGYRGQATRDRLGPLPEIYLDPAGRRQVFRSISNSLPMSFHGVKVRGLILLAYGLERLGRRIYAVVGMKSGRTSILSAVVDPVTESEVVVRMVRAAQQGQALLVTYLTGWTLVLACEDKRFADQLRQFDICYADGVGVIYALLISRFRRVRKVTANEFFFNLCDEAERRGISIALIGARPGIAQDLARRIHLRFPSLCLPVLEKGFLRPDDEEEVLQ